MEVVTRKRFISMSSDGPNSKVSAIDQSIGLADIITLNVLHAINTTDPVQRVPLLDDMIARLQWLRQQYEQIDTSMKKSMNSSKHPITSPHHNDTHIMQSNIHKQQEMLQSMSKLINLSAQTPVPNAHTPTQTLTLPRTAPKAPIPSSVPHSVITAPPAPPSVPSAPPPTLTPQVTKRSPVPAAPSTPPKRLEPPVPPILRKMEPIVAPHVPPNHPPSLTPKNLNLQATEDYIFDLESKQRKLLSYISSAHGGKVTDDILHEYLKHPYVLLKENGVVRQQQNPFFHLLGPSAPTLVPPAMKMMASPAPPPNPPATATMIVSKTSQSPPIPAPPVLVPQVELPMRKESAYKKEELSPPEQHSPPPQLKLQVPIMAAKPFEPPAIRPCNQWSVFSMALPLKLICRCYPMPCNCQN
ncbi:unnamed protein product [Caenorhabditis sp. 36 PRJEB53466]|nr:unnamed protein product [Caenorhabditis sp. 36 PRJEB53466]